VHEKLSISDSDILREYASRWTIIARPGQIPPEDVPWFAYFMRSGRGGGKTRSGSEWILKRVRQGYKHIALIGETAADVRDTMVELGESSIMKVARPHERPTYEPSKRRLTFPNGAVATTFTGEEPDQMRGPQFDTAWIDELAKFQYPQEVWDNLEFALRLGKKPQVFITTTPRPIPIIKKLLKDKSTIDVRFATSDNAANLSPQFLERMQEKYAGTRLGRQELDGEVLEDNPDALWTRVNIENNRVSMAPSLSTIVVAVDPTTAEDGDGDAAGIIVAGIDCNKHAYVLKDCTVQGSPLDWAKAAVSAYHLYQANLIVAEKNQGGEMVRLTLQQVDKNVPVKLVHASRGKIVRAEPVSAKYEQNLVHHVGVFPQLEDQLCEWTPRDKTSPDRLDALVWAMTELMDDSFFSDCIFED
jgi:phage terminase large subunit-like protein